MTKCIIRLTLTKAVAIVFVTALCSVGLIRAQDLKGPDTLLVPSGNLTLKALFWRPNGKGPFPTIIFCHGSYRITDTIITPEQQISSIGSLFASKGYIYFALFRRGVGLSKSQGKNCADLMYDAFIEKGPEERNIIQLQQLETDQLQDMIAGLGILRKRKDVDTSRIVIMGHSFGGSLAFLLAEHEPGIKAVITFGASGYSWDRSPILRARLISAIRNVNVPVMIIHAQNDYSTTPGYSMDSLMNKLNKPHLLVIYPPFGNSPFQGHNMISLGIDVWEKDVFKFLEDTLGN